MTNTVSTSSLTLSSTGATFSSSFFYYYRGLLSLLSYQGNTFASRNWREPPIRRSIYTNTRGASRSRSGSDDGVGPSRQNRNAMILLRRGASRSRSSAPPKKIERTKDKYSQLNIYLSMFTVLSISYTQWLIVPIVVLRFVLRLSSSSVPVPFRSSSSS